MVELSTGSDGTPPPPPPPFTVTINQAAGQGDPTNGSPNFTVVFSAPVTDFGAGDVTLGGTAGASTAVVTGSGTTYNVEVSGMTGDGTVTASIAAGAAPNVTGSGNASSTSTDNTISYDATRPSVVINQAAGQSDPTSGAPINFAVVFSEPVNDFATGDVTLGGGAGATAATVTGSGATYNVAVNGMTVNGTVIASVAAGAAQDGAGNGNAASTSTDNTVSYTTASAVPPAAPINLRTTTAISQTQVNLAWTDKANNETGFEVQRCTGKNCNNFTPLQQGNVGANITSYLDSTVVRNTNYGYRVRAYNDSGQSFSNVLRVKTPR